MCPGLPAAVDAMKGLSIAVYMTHILFEIEQLQYPQGSCEYSGMYIGKWQAGTHEAGIPVPRMCFTFSALINHVACQSIHQVSRSPL